MFAFGGDNVVQAKVAALVAKSYLLMREYPTATPDRRKVISEELKACKEELHKIQQ